MSPLDQNFSRPPRLLSWTQSTAVLVASGPSLTAADVEHCRGRAKVLAINDNYRLAPWADALYACDLLWWIEHKGVPSFTGPKYTHSYEAARDFGLERFDGRPLPGLSRVPGLIHLGGNGGYQAMNIVAQFGVAKILLLGFDMGDTGGRAHWFGDHPESCRKGRAHATWIAAFESAVPDLQDMGIEVVNCSRATRLTCFRQSTIEAEL